MAILERVLIPLGLLVFLARPVSSQTPTEHLFASPEASSTAIELTIILETSPTKTVYSVSDGGRVLRQELVHRTGKVWREEVRYISSLEVSNFLELLAEGEVMTYKPSDFSAHFPDGPLEVIDSSTYILRVFDPPVDSARGPKRAEHTTSMRHPEYYAERAPGFSPARALADLKAFLDRLFE